MTKHLALPYLAIFSLLALAIPVQAKLFKNAYVAFDLPERWDCKLEGTEWVCNSGVPEDAKRAIIVLTAKETGPSDTLDQYETYLKTPKTLPTNQGKPFTSVVKNVRQRQIVGHPWVDGLHLGSEVPTYYTRYLATVKQRIAILVTFSAHQRHYTKFSTDFFNAIESLRVIASGDLLSPKQGAPDLSAGERIGVAGPIDVGAGGVQDEEYPAESSGPNSSKQKLLGFGVLLAAVGALLVLKRRKKKNKPF